MYKHIFCDVFLVWHENVTQKCYTTMLYQNGLPKQYIKMIYKNDLTNVIRKCYTKMGKCYKQMLCKNVIQTFYAKITCYTIIVPNMVNKL